MSGEDTKDNLYVGASLLLGSVIVLVASAFVFRSPRRGASDIFGNSNRVSQITNAYPSSFAPRGWFGRGGIGAKTYAYSLAWGLIWLLLVVASVYIFVLAVDENVSLSKTEVSEIYLGCAALSASLLACCAWLPIFRLWRASAFLFSAFVLFVSYILSLVGVYFLLAWERGVAFGIFVGLGSASLSGWLLIALALNVNTVGLAYAHGDELGDAPFFAPGKTDVNPFWPLVLSFWSAIVAVFFKDPGQPFPLLCLLLFSLPKTAGVWISVLFCVVGISLSCVILVESEEGSRVI